MQDLSALDPVRINKDGSNSFAWQKDLSSQPGIKPGSPEMEARSSNHWTAGGFPWHFVLAASAN